MQGLRSSVFFAAALFAASAAAQQRPVSPKYNDVMTAVVYDDTGGLEQLLALGKWPDKPDSEGRTPLLVALKLGYTGLAEALLNAGADPERALIAARGLGDRQMVARLESQLSSAGPSGKPGSQ
jgi:hypothetical protein